jgi:hypothetical protein
MNIPFALRSLKADWIRVVTSTGFSVATLAISYLPLGQAHPWIPWLAFVIMWSISLGWAFVSSWNREHRKVFVLVRELLIPELERVRREASPTGLTFSSEDSELDFYFEKIKAASRGMDREFVKEAIAISKQCQPIVAIPRARPRISRL